MPDLKEHNRSLPPPQPAKHDALSYIFGGAFVVSAIMALLGAINTIRHNFFQAHIGGYPGSSTPFTDIMNDNEVARKNVVADFNAGKKTTTEYWRELEELRISRANLIEDRLLKKFNIPSKGFAGLTIGNYERWKRAGQTTKNNALFTIAATSAVAIGAIVSLRYSQKVTENAERTNNKMDELINALENSDNGLSKR